MSHRILVLVPSVLLIASCATKPPQFDWFQEAEQFHAIPPPTEVSAKILSGFDAPSTSSPAVGDEILFALSLDSPVGVENWYLHMTIAEISEDRKRVGFALTVFDENGESLGTSQDRIKVHHLTTGIAAAAIKPKNPEVVANAIGSLRAVLTILQRNDILAPVLWKIVKKPPIVSILMNLGIRAEIAIGASQDWQSKIPESDWEIPTWRIPMVATLNDIQAINLSLVVIDPASPLNLSAGITSLVAVRPDGSGTRFRMHAIAARRHRD
ncbi:MAG: hypothetical protein QF412_11125 [Planctomycetota bacterium]|jgi:hypothetical protein|nr:hypothetical protein [Planctomycetota bacterium]